MKSKLRFSSIALLLVIFFAGSCKKDNLRIETAEGSVEFSYGVKSDKSTKANAVPFAAVVSITDENDLTVVENQELKFYNINGSYLTEKLTLTAGNYKLSHYVIVSQTNEVIYATPIQGSELAYLVNTPLTIDITVAEEQASQTIPEVIEVADFTADQFGYSYFGLQKVEIFNFAVDLFTKDANSEVLSPATGTITVTGDAVELFNGQLEAKTNAIYLRDGYTNYTVTVEKEGCTAYSKTFTVDELKVHSNAQGNNPLTVVLDNNSNGDVWFTVELSEASTVSFTLRGYDGKKVSINWNDASEIENIDLNNDISVSHSYSGSGTFTIYVAGDVDAINMISFYEINITEIDITKAINLNSFYCSGGGLSSIDLSRNKALSFLVVDRNNLTNLDVSNNVLLSTLICSFNQLNNLNISNNTALYSLLCFNNPLGSLDVSNNNELTSLLCFENQLTNLNVSNNKSLQEIRCSSNSIKNLDVSNNTELTRLWCYENQLTKLDISNNTALVDLSVHTNEIENLDIRNNTSLENLNCRNNLISNIDISNNTALEELYCSKNQLSNLDLSNNAALKRIGFSYNQLTQLNIRNGNNAILSYFYATYNPNLTTICVDDGFENGATNWYKDDTANYSSTCQ